MYLYDSPAETAAMLESIGAASIEELFRAIPSELRLDRTLDIPGPLGELELTRHVAGLAGRNLDANRAICFLGAGSYDHFVPSVVDMVASRSEFYTSYTPYQPEVSQGNLQVMFEYQTLICDLTGMDVSNASLYEGGSATIEAILMAMSATRRHGKVVMLRSVHPEYRQIARTYLRPHDVELVELGWAVDGRADLQQAAERIDESTACLVIQHPNFFGALEPVRELVDAAHGAGALVVHVFDPISLGILRRPGDVGADIAVAEGQSLGTPMLYGGPYLGILACRETFLRRLPGRIAGQTVDRRGKRCWVLTLQTREQHIRREKATSNICTNQGLFALRAAVYLALMGPHGLREAARQCLFKARAALESLAGDATLSRRFDAPFFKEFAVRDGTGDVAGRLERAKAEGVLAGVPLGTWYPELEDSFLVAVTEKRTADDIDAWSNALRGSS